METQNFEKKLSQMTKPDVSHLKHQDMLADVIIKAKDRFALSAWWLSIPLYTIAAFIMKRIFIPQATMVSSIHEFAAKEKYLSVLIFLIVPIAFTALNIISIRKVYILLGGKATMEFVRTVWFNFLIILFAVLTLFIYLF